MCNNERSVSCLIYGLRDGKSVRKSQIMITDVAIIILWELVCDSLDVKRDIFYRLKHPINTCERDDFR